MAAERKPIARKTCACCKESLPRNSFYSSKNPADKDGLVRWCKSCIVKNCLVATGEINITEFQETLKALDKPFFVDILESSEEEYHKAHIQFSIESVKRHGKDIIGKYFKNINSLRQASTKTYADSQEMDFCLNADIRTEKEEKAKQEKKKVTLPEKEKFELTEDIVRLFGEGFPLDEYRRMYKKYLELTKDRPLQSNLDKETLVAYVRFKVKEEIATARGDSQTALKWYNAAMDAAKEGILTPKSITGADLHNGVNTVSEIFKAVEEAVDVIPILPQFKYAPKDAVDFTIWCYINYERDLNGKEQCSYEDVYGFYDKKKQEYVDQYGDPYHIFDEDPTEDNRENVKQFITLPEDY